MRTLLQERLLLKSTQNDALGQDFMVFCTDKDGRFLLPSDVPEYVPEAEPVNFPTHPPNSQMSIEEIPTDPNPITEIMSSPRSRLLYLSSSQVLVFPPPRQNSVHQPNRSLY
jgi:hypothetical protein